MKVEKQFSGRFKVLLIFLLINSAAEIFVSLVSVNANALYAQPRYPFDDYRDRREGITDGKELINSDADIELVSAFIDNSEISPEDDPSEYHLGFYVPENAQANVVVEEFAKFYKMEILKKDFTTGAFHFSWPSEIPKHYQIKLNDLAPLARVLPPGSQKIIPIVLYTHAFSKSEVRYRFGVVPYSDVSVLEYSIYDAMSNTLVYSARLENLNADPEITYIRWNGHNQDNNKVDDGLYSLFIEATFRSSPSTPAYQVTEKYDFYHFSQLLEKLPK